jgi:hypothetical protein
MEDLEQGTIWFMWCEMVDQEVIGLWNILFPRCVRLYDNHRTLLIDRLGVLLYFVIPRNPSFQFYPERPFDVDNSTISFSRTPTNFSFTGNLNLYGTSPPPNNDHADV